MSSLSVLYERPVSRAWVAEGERIRAEYERICRRIERREERKAVVASSRPLAFKKKPLVLRCACGCRKRLPPRTHYYSMYLPGHMASQGGHSMTKRQLREQLERIPDTELGRLAKRCLLRELGL